MLDVSHVFLLLASRKPEFSFPVPTSVLIKLLLTLHSSYLSPEPKSVNIYFFKPLILLLITHLRNTLEPLFSLSWNSAISYFLKYFYVFGTDSTHPCQFIHNFSLGGIQCIPLSQICRQMPEIVF
jgi:hypothetical protein